jgi:hypothetical protein
MASQERQQAVIDQGDWSDGRGPQAIWGKSEPASRSLCLKSARGANS